MNKTKDNTMDVVLPFHLEKSAIRGRLVRLDTSLKTITGKHSYPGIVNEYLAQAAVISLAMANCFKFEGLFTLQITGDGPLRLLVVDYNTNGNLRACARFDEEKLTTVSQEDQMKVHHVIGQGQLVFTIEPDQGEDRYQGVVTLSPGMLSESIHHFFRQSEQLETGVKVSATLQKDQVQATALMIQRLPLPEHLSEEEREQEDDSWIHALSVLGSLSNKEMLDPHLSNEDLLYRLFWEQGVRVHACQQVTAQCRCSQEKIYNLIKGFKEEDRQEMVVDGHIEVICEFCSQAYLFTLDDFSEDPV